MALHLEMFFAKGSKARIRSIYRESIAIDLLVAPMSLGSILAMTARKGGKKREKSNRSPGVCVDRGARAVHGKRAASRVRGGGGFGADRSDPARDESDSP